MMRELTEEDFARGVKNPHFHKLARKVEVTVTHEDWDTFVEFARLSGGVRPELIMQRGLVYWAQELREED
ncbi:MAG: hypothetical protein FWB74_08275 [Defluviitaleaceae bacterium]|nr:hypothetical protein [Defluviitaleaceae bacterium]